MDYRIKTESVSVPVTLDEAREHVRPDSDGEDDVLIQRCIETAVTQAETITRSALARRVYVATGSQFPARSFTLRNPPLVSVDEIKVIQNGLEVILDPITYQVNTAASPGRIQPAPGLQWPRPDGGLFAAVSIEYTAGYALLEARVKLAILTLVSHYYENRQTAASTAFTPKTMSHLTEALLADFIR